MSWFGETFGDSLNTLKGQITKITKEVLAETDESATASEEPESSSFLLEELEALCRSKDLEIASLREELNKLHHQYISQLELYKNQNEKIITNSGNDLQIKQFTQLENELHQLRQERDHLNSCLDELQLEHQVNLNEVIYIRDKYKTELEELSIEYNAIKTKLDELMKNQNEILKSNDSSKLIEGKESEISSLYSQAESFLVEKEPDEKEKAIRTLKKDTQNQQVMKKKLEKLPSDIEAINKNKQKTEEINKTFQFENENLRSKMSLIKQENKEIEIKPKMVLNEKEELTKKLKCQNSDRSKLSPALVDQLEIENKIKNLLKMLNINADEKLNEYSMIRCLSLFENEWTIRQKCEQEINAKLQKVARDLESEVKKLKEEKEYLENEMKISIDKWTETEKKCQEEIIGLHKLISEMKTQRQHCINQSQTDDVKRLEQEVAQFMNLLLTKNNEIKDYSKSVNNLEQELGNLKTTSLNMERELGVTNKEKRKLEEEVEQLKKKDFAISQEKINLEEKLRDVESENSCLKKINAELQQEVRELAGVSAGNVRMKTLEAELEKAQLMKAEAENCCTELQKANLDLKNEFERVKAQVIVKETSLVELMKSNTAFQEEINKIQAQSNELQKNAEREIKKWKDVSVDLEIQRQDLLSKKEELETECLALRSELELSKAEVAEMTELKQANSNLMESANQLHHALENKAQSEKLCVAKENKLEERCQQQVKLILELQEENDELKSRVNKFQEQMKVQMIQSQSRPTSKDDVQQHRRSKSAIDMKTSPMREIQKPGGASGEDMSVLKHVIQQEQARYRSLQSQFQEISEKESNAKKEFERLKQHLIEIEDHYTEEAVENSTIINDLKSKLTAAEEQLQNSSTLYTSMKVRDNQHLESLQSQIRLMSTQRDDFQAKLSTAEDEVQKHKASLMSLQIVLEQFQQDKEREVEGIAVKYEKQLQVTHGRFQDLEVEIEGLKKQLAEAKNGLKAASRLGEQLEKKKEQVAELEGSFTHLKDRVRELEDNLTAANQSSNAKIDKSLIKNLVVGYVLSPNTDRKSQVLKIMASVLDFDQDERNKMGVDSTYSGWLSNILRPKGGGSSSNQSLSEAFIRFLENESRPQPQVKFSPEQFESKTTKSSKPAETSPQQKSGRFSELMLPTFNSSQENESSVILKSVLKDS